MDNRQRVLNFLCGKAQYAIYELIQAIPLDDRADIRTRLLHDEARQTLIAALRSCQILYGLTSPPPAPLDPCPCGCDAAEGATAPRLPTGGSGTHSE